MQFFKQVFFSVYLGLRLCKDEARCELDHRSRTRKKGQVSESARHWVENFRLRPDCGCSISAGASGEEQESKTANATRIIDIPEVFASELTGYVSEVRAICVPRRNKQNRIGEHHLRALEMPDTDTWAPQRP